MSDAKHTPGPWVTILAGQRHKYKGSDITSVSVYSDKTRGELNDKGHSYRNDPSYVDNIEIMSQFVGDLSLEEANANARLIAASPDLLEALIRLAEDREAKAIEPELDADLQSAMRAIAKAKGETA